MQNDWNHKKSTVNGMIYSQNSFAKKILCTNIFAKTNHINDTFSL